MGNTGTGEPKLPPDIADDLKNQLEDTSGGDLAIVEATSTGRGKSTYMCSGFHFEVLCILCL